MLKTLPALGVVLCSQLALANSVTAVSANGGSVSISASAPPNFTTFTMSNPPRLVIDVAEASVKGVPTDINVGQNDIVAIKAMNYGTGNAAVARIMITYTKGIDTDILTNGSNIVVRPTSSGPSMQELPAGAAAAPVARQVDTTPSPRRRTARPLLENSPAAPAPLSSDEIATEAPPTQTVRLDPAPMQNTPPPADNGAPAPTEAPPGEAPVQGEATPAAQAAAGAPAAAAPTGNRSAADEAASPSPPVANGEIQVSPRRKRLTLVGLRFNGQPSVFIRTNEPVKYSQTSSGNGITVTIENTRITRHNDTRPLDVHFFDSPISTVRARQSVATWWCRFHARARPRRA